MATRRCKGRVFGGSIKASLQAYQTSAALAAGTGSMTLNVWVRISPESYAEVATHEIAGYADVSYATTGWLLSQYSFAIYLYHQNGGAPILAGILPRTVINRWVMVTVVYDAGTGKAAMYLDGAQLVAPTSVTWNISANSTFNIGANGFGGMIGESRISRTTYWNGTALTAAQIATLYYDGTEPGTPTWIFDATPTVATTTPNTGSLGGNITTNTAQWWYRDVPCLVRQSRQNKIKYGDDLSNAAWTKYQCSVAVSATTHPTRTGAAVWRVTENTAVGDAHACLQVQSSPSTTGARRALIKAKAGSAGRGIGLGVNGGAAAVYVNLSTGVITPVGAAITGSGIRPLGNGWYEIMVEYTDTGGNMVLYMTSGGVTTYNGDGTSYIEVCDASIHEIARPKEYLDTTAYVVEYGASPVEKQVENILPYSNTLTSWTNAGTTIAANGNAWDVTDDNAAGYEYITDTTPAASLNVGKRYCFSMFIKKTVGATSGIAVNVTMAAYTAGLRMNPNTGVVTTSSSTETASSVGSEPVKIGSDDYWHVWMVFTAQASATTVYFYPAACALSGDAVGSDSTARTGTATVYNMSLTRGAAPPRDYYATTLAAGWLASPARRGQMPKQNLLSYANDMTNAAWSAQAGVVVTSGATAPDGTATAFNVDLSGAAVATGIYQIIGLAAGAQAKVRTTRSCWVKGASGTVSFTDPASGNGVVTLTMDGTWQLARLTEDCSIYGCGFWMRKGTATSIQIWHPSVSRDEGPEEEWLGTGYKYASAFTRAGRGQGRRQNFIKYSNDMSNAGTWARLGLTSVTALGNVGPGGRPAFRLTDINSGTNHSVSQAVPTPVAGRVYTMAALVRAGTKTSVVLAPEGAAYQVTFNLSAVTATTTSGTVINKGIVSVGGGWYLCYLTYVSLGFTDTRFYIQSTSYTADGTGTVDYCAPQITATNGVAPYVETTSNTTIDYGAPRSLAQ